MPAKILIVEDHDDSREILRIQIERLGYEVIEARSGAEAIEKALAQNPDLIIMDLRLPGINGIEAAVVLKQSSNTSHIPVIAHSASREENCKAEALKAGMVEFLPKPTPLKVFGEVLQSVLQGNSRKMASTA